MPDMSKYVCYVSTNNTALHDLIIKLLHENIYDVQFNATDKIKEYISLQFSKQQIF